MWSQFLVFSVFVVISIGVGSTPVEERKPRPDLHLAPFTSSEERIRSHGYPAESHYVETSDGYVLHLFRLPYSHKLANQYTNRPAILLQHGLLSNSDCWLSSGPDHSLAYNLVDAGYDVWLGNARGNIYSRNNTKISLNNPKYWQFSWHEIGVVDIAAMIDYILETTGHAALHYAGHSQGTTAYFVLMSERPEYNDKIKTAHMLAPCAFFEHGRAAVFERMAPLVGTPTGVWYNLLYGIEFLPKNAFFNRLTDTVCGAHSPEHDVCHNVYFRIFGDASTNMNTTALQVLIETHPGGGSSNQGIHYIQLYCSHKFRQYDFGAEKNKNVYADTVPPDYDLSQITAQTYLYSSANDALCGPADVDMLISQLSHTVDDYRITKSTWTHLDFIAANEIKEVINDRVVRICNEYEAKS